MRFMTLTLALTLAITLTLVPTPATGSSSSGTRYELSTQYDPVANGGAVVTSGNARFTILTPRVIRCEYASSATFVDAATTAFINRNTTVPEYTKTSSNGVLKIETAYLSLTYSEGKTFSASSLQIASVANAPPAGSRSPRWTQKHAPKASPAFETWVYGAEPHKNLEGTIKSLDLLGVVTLNCTENANLRIHDESLHCRWGLVSRSGWAAVQDADNYLLTKDLGWWEGDSNPVQNPNQDDVYFFGHGSDYMGALEDFVLLAGKIPMAPRYSAGIFRTRWYDYAAHDVLDVVDDYLIRSIPLDVVILDMDWHVKFDGSTQNIWGAYSWDERLYPIPEAFVAALSAKNLPMMVNIHDDNGIATGEAMYKQAAAALGVSSGAPIPFDIVSRNYSYVLEDIVLGAVVDAAGAPPYGIDTGSSSYWGGWWTDFQQGGNQGNTPGGYLSAEIVLNKLRGTDYMRRGINQRDYTLSRWGGFGNHRYGQGFSGGTYELVSASERQRA